MLARRFRELNKREFFWRNDHRVLLAVSGGVDSMVLLELFKSLPVAERPFFAVAHVNHQLRPESQEEATFLEAFCQDEGILFYEKTWQARPAGNLENQARQARYSFFTEICQDEGFDCLVTAHHGDDQAETILMKLISGSQLQNLVGIRPTSQRDGLVIHRPLLAFSKDDLLAWALTHQISYFEDASNLENDYFRNRIRNQIMPQFKAENANFLKHIHNFVKQIAYANDIIEVKVNELWPKVIHTINNQWSIDLRSFRSLSESQQYMLLVSLWQKVLVVEGVPVNEEQLTQALTMLTSDAGAQEIHLAAGWRFEKNYQEACLKQVESEVSVEQLPQSLSLGQGQFISQSEWLGFERVDQPLDRPDELSRWQVFECPVGSELAPQTLVVRRVQAGDRLIYNQAGNHKKVSRVFIDAKIPLKKREQTWLVCDSMGEIIWIVPIRKSYLSIVKETDKIHYRLIYLKSGSDNELQNFSKD